MIDRNESPNLPPRGVRVVIWIGLGILLLVGSMSLERFLLPDAVADERFIGAAAPAAVYLWVAGLNVLLGLVDVDSRDAIPLTGWGLVVACAGFATGTVTYLAVKAQAPTLLAGFGAVIPLFANVAVLLAGLLLTARAYRLLGR
jgi:hypothetical protein